MQAHTYMHTFVYIWSFEVFEHIYFVHEYVHVCVHAHPVVSVCVLLDSRSLPPTCVTPHYDLVLCNQASFI